MAGRSRLKRRAGPRLAALAAVVVLAHLVGIEWIAGQLQQVSALRALPTPMFTRLLQQEAAAPPVAATAAAPAAPRRSTITSVARKPAARPAARPASQAAEPELASASQPAELDQPSLEPSVASGTTTTASSADALVPAAPPIEQAASQPEPTAGATATSTATTTASADTAPSDSWPADTRLNYRLGGLFRSGELHGRAWVQWQRDGNRYETRIDIDITLLASLVVTSQGEVAPQGLVPKAYEELRRSGVRSLRLGDESITLGDGRRVPRPEGVQDTASQFVELSHRFATGKEPLEVGRSVSFWMARPGGVDLWTYDIVDRATLQTEHLGAVEAFHLKPRPIVNPRGNITAEMWFAPSLQYLPVRIRVSMGEGTFVDLIVDKIEQR